MITPKRNRVSITNLSSRINTLWKSVFTSNNKAVPVGLDTITIHDANGVPYYCTLNQLSAIIGTGLLPVYTSATLPSADPHGQVIYISDLGVMAYSNGTNWIS